LLLPPSTASLLSQFSHSHHHFNSAHRREKGIPMSTNLIDASRRMSAAEIERHYEKTNVENSRWTHLEMRRREISHLLMVVTNDLEKFPSRHSAESFTLYTGILRTLCIYEKEIERLKDGVPMSADWVATLVDTLNRAIEQRRSLLMLLPKLAAFDLSKRTSDADATVYKVLNASIEQFTETAHKFLDEQITSQ
jgi:hypothetical protein